MPTHHPHRCQCATSSTGLHGGFPRTPQTPSPAPPRPMEPIHPSRCCPTETNPGGSGEGHYRVAVGSAAGRHYPSVRHQRLLNRAAGWVVPREARVDPPSRQLLSVTVPHPSPNRWVNPCFTGFIPDMRRMIRLIPAMMLPKPPLPNAGLSLPQGAVSARPRLAKTVKIPLTKSPNLHKINHFQKCNSVLHSPLTPAPACRSPPAPPAPPPPQSSTPRYPPPPHPPPP